MGDTPLRDHRAEWNATLERVRNHIANQGYPTQRTVAADGFRPGKWIAKQKERWGTLAPEQREALLSLPGFALNAREAHFDDMLDAYIRATAAGVPLLRKEDTYDGYPIGQWLHDVWRGRITLTEERVEKLRQARIIS